MKRLGSKILKSFKKGIQLLSGYERRQYVAELAKEYFDGSPTKTERYLGVNRQMVIKALGEDRTGIRCIDAYSLRGRKKKKQNTQSLKRT